MDKPADYYAADRHHFLEWVGGAHETVLDVGCGSGVADEWLRSRGAKRVVGVEPDPAAAASAARRYDYVEATTIEAALSRLKGPFDLIICGDVLEHLVDPWQVVREFRRVSTAGTTLAVSVPNIRYYRAVLAIAFGPGFRYAESGHFDSTHLRFFTRRNLDELLTLEGWRVTRWGGPHSGRMGPILARLTRGVTDEWLRYQWYATAQLQTEGG